MVELGAARGAPMTGQYTHKRHKFTPGERTQKKI
jgi:hypothetical protein